MQEYFSTGITITGLVLESVTKIVLVTTLIRDNSGAAEYICGDRCPRIHTLKSESMVPAVHVISRVNPDEFSILRRFGVGCLWL